MSYSIDLSLSFGSTESNVLTNFRHAASSFRLLLLGHTTTLRKAMARVSKLQ